MYAIKKAGNSISEARRGIYSIGSLGSHLTALADLATVEEEDEGDCTGCKSESQLLSLLQRIRKICEDLLGAMATERKAKIEPAHQWPMAA